ncbi:MAG: T9SS type A sorting domain-containing protein [Bacteroidota bacterium]
MIFSVWGTALFAQPANDGCTDAIAITGLVDSIAFTTIDATSNGPDHPLACLPSGGATPEVIYSDIWYLWTAEATQSVEFTTCNRADFDTKIAVYKAGAVCPLTDDDVMACSEDAPGCANFESAIIFEAEEGQSYLLRIGGWGEEEPGSFGSGSFAVLEYTASDAPANDECIGAIELILDSADSTFVEFISDGALTSQPMHSGEGCFDTDELFVYNDVWYSWTATFDGFLEWSNCGTSNFDSRMAVYIAGPNPCEVSADSLIGCSDDGLDENDFNCAGFTSRAIFPVETGKTYKFRLGGWSASDAGEGTFTVKRFTPPPVPANDNCANAAEAFIITPEQADNFEVIFEGTNRGASFEAVNPLCRQSGEFQDVWYRFNSGFNTELAIFFSPTTDNTAFIVDLFSACGEIVPAEEIDFCIQLDETTVEVVDGFPGEPTEWLLRISTRITTERPGDFFFQLVGEPFVNTQELALTEFNFYPNPVSGQAFLNFHMPESSDTDVIVLNAVGQEVQRTNFGYLRAGAQRLSLDLEHLPAGVYILNIQQETGTKATRFVKE